MRFGLALRSTVFSPSTISKIIPPLEGSKVDSVWFSSAGQAFDSLDMCGVSLGESQRLRIGTGVIPYTDFDARRLLARVHTLNEGSEGRFVLGIGTGSSTGAAAIDGLVKAAARLRADYPEQQKPPPIFFAALKRPMLRSAYLNADGAILNFCPPTWVEKIKPNEVPREGFTLACYIKLFFAEKGEVARKMLVNEIKMYASFPHYHAMFEKMGAADAISRLDTASPIPEKILEISSANPGDDEISRTLERFRHAGVDLPIVYPYVSGDERYKLAVVERLSRLD